MSLLQRLRTAEFGRIALVRAYLRRRVGRRIAGWRWPRAEFGLRCDVRRPISLRVARGAIARFGPECVLDSGLVVECRGRLTVGRGTVFGHHCTIAAQEAVEIGRHCLIAELVSIRDHDHAFADLGRPTVAQGRTTAPIRIGDNVWLGSKVTVTAGVTIGANTVVGAHAVVTRDLPENVVAVGIPARVLRSRIPERSPEELLESGDLPGDERSEVVKPRPGDDIRG